ncbi:MAG: hypothetical protein CSB44_07920 [Gammaproteobacteria bacterium]|nr:MAG: hypothetical protein CSB44_07920 [Gammaproteobacteria bacterium]
MIDQNDHSASADPDDAADAFPPEPSKSQRKRDTDAVRALGEELAALPASTLDTLPIPDDVRSAVDELQRISRHGAKKRQLGYLARRMRQIDLAPLRAALEKERNAARLEIRRHHLLEQWRDRLLGKVAEETPAAALTALLDSHTGADSQRLRQLQRQALAEQSTGKPPRAARELFRELRQLFAAAQDEHAAIDETNTRDLP